MAISSWRLELSRVTASLLRLPPPLWGRSVRTIREGGIDIRGNSARPNEPAEPQPERHIMARKLILIVALIGAASSPAFAQYRGSQAEQAACRRDAVHFCRGISDDAQVESCLVAHRHQVSARCRHVLQTHGR